MKTLELMNKFSEMFPQYGKADKIERYDRIGKDALKITFKSGVQRVFLYRDPENWIFGTRLYWQRPKNERNEGGKNTSKPNKQKKTGWGCPTGAPGPAGDPGYVLPPEVLERHIEESKKIESKEFQSHDA